ncbi:MAG: hypothetical protein R8J84_07685 [Mariprofundales bacterium]
MRRHFLLLLGLMSLMVMAKITLPLWSHHATPANTALASATAASETPQHLQPPSATHAAATSSLLSSPIHNALIPSAIAETSIANAAESLPTGKDAELLSSLRQRNKLLDAREKEIEERKTALEDMEKRATSRIAELKTMEASLRDMLKQEDSIKNKKIKRLTAVYESMKPDRAAAVIAGMDLGTVIKVFLRMKEKKVGKILSFLPAKTAVVVSEALTRRISSLKK